MNPNFYQRSNLEYNEFQQQPNVSSGYSYLFENILRFNQGKKARLFVTIPGSGEWQDKIFEGTIEDVGKDYVVLFNPSNGEWYLIVLFYLNYVVFDEAITFHK